MNAHFSLIITIFFCTLVFDINSKILQFKQNSNISQVYIQEQNNEPKQLDEVQKEIGLYINENLEFNDNVKYVSAFVNPNLARLSQNDLSIGEGTKIIHQIISKSSKPKKSENRNEEKAQGFLAQSKRISASLN
jgi:uncharacterized membrane protein